MLGSIEEDPDIYLGQTHRKKEVSWKTVHNKTSKVNSYDRGHGIGNGRFQRPNN